MTKPQWKGRGGIWLELKCFWNEVFLLRFWNLQKKKCLVWEYKDIDKILLVEQIDDMKLSHWMFANKFQASLESIFDLPHVKKVLTQIMHNATSNYFFIKV